jgi:6,7-dimethyl-8-ribityllumazine synthase
MIQEQQTLAFDKKFTKKLKIAIVRTSYHRELVDNLEVLAKATLMTAGVPENSIKTIVVPGSWEIPILVQKVAESKKVKYDGIIALGVIVKGETFHFELIANEVTSALMQLSVDNRIPIAYEVLAVSDIKHAEARAGKDTNNKGIEAANALLQTILALRTIKK